mmetsp:Transcript_15079/g.27227  ORF Transcript_15079/g.27227 Transcript_15079/m.27227 type:complete len:89 (-) Transcript_15079:648-914(-)
MLSILTHNQIQCKAFLITSDAPVSTHCPCAIINFSAFQSNMASLAFLNSVFPNGQNVNLQSLGVLPCSPTTPPIFISNPLKPVILASS